MVNDDQNDQAGAVILDALASLELEPRRLPIYDREVGLRLLTSDPRSGAEHYLVRYPAGMRSQPHTHTASQTIVVVEGALEANGTVIRAGGYCHFPGGAVMRHAPAEGADCLFITMFDGPFDVVIAS